ncbi:MAG: hypothetical protein QM781_13175 [Chitinophagaceae bacterium]
MINIFDFDVILQQGIKWFSSTDTIEGVTNEFGKPNDIEFYDDGNIFYHYDNIKLGFRDSKLERVVIYFLNFENEYKITSIDSKPVLLNRDISVGLIIQYLNAKQIKWFVKYEESMHDYLVIDLESGARIFFYLYSGQLERITL